MSIRHILAVALAALCASAQADVDFSIPESEFPFVDAWLGQFSDELGEAIVFGTPGAFTKPAANTPSSNGPKKRTWELYRTAAKFFEASRDFLANGQRLDDAGKLEALPWRVVRMNDLPNLECHPRIHHAVWQAGDGRKALVLANVSWADTDWRWSGYGREFSGRLAHNSYAFLPLWDVPDTVDAVACAGGTKSIRDKPFSQGGARYPGATWNFDRADWTAFDRLVIDIVAHGEGGDKLQLYVKDSWTKNSQDDWVLDTFTPGACGVYRWTVQLNAARRTSCVLRSVKQLHVFTSQAVSPDYTFAAVRLVRRGADLPPPLPIPADVAQARKRRNAEHAQERIRSMSGMMACGEMRVGIATAMDKVRPDRPLQHPFSLTRGEKARVSLARNEHEALQILVGNAGTRTLENVRVNISPLRRTGAAPCVFPATNATVGVTGYVRTRGLPRYTVGFNVPTNSPAGYVRLTKRADPGWYPDPVLDYLQCADVRPSLVQSFWIDIHCPEQQPAGTYAGEISVSSEKNTAAKIPFEVTVRDFAIPRASPMPLAISFWPADSSPCRKAVDARLDSWADFLADHFITIDSLYLAGRPRWEQLLRLKRQGRLNKFQLSMWADFKRSPEAEKEWLASPTSGKPRLDAAYAKAKELGLLDHAYIYGMDEQPKERFAAMRDSLPDIKKWYPGVPIMTTCFDYTYGEDGVLSDIDVFIPDTQKFDPAKADAARANGRKVWWYLACVPHAPYANFFVEGEGIEPRSLMGVQAVKYRPDGFLYYATAIWRDNKPVTGGPFTQWNPFSWGGPGNEYHGDGSWTIPGPDGRPLETVRLYNFRDGLEDYAYAKLLFERTGEWPEVPASIVESVSNFTTDTTALLRWREELARRIEKSYTEKK